MAGPCACAFVLYTLPLVPSFGCCYSWWCQLGKLTASTPCQPGRWELGVGGGGGKERAASLHSWSALSVREWGLPAQPRPGLGRLQVPGCGFGTICVHRTFLFFSPSHLDFLVKSQLAFCHVSVWIDCPHARSISSSFLLPMAVCQSGPGTFGPTRQWPALTISVLHARPCARGYSYPWLQIRDVLFILTHSLQKRETETGECVK